jgi:ABC-2 type transport system ATP-binding protein
VGPAAVLVEGLTADHRRGLFSTGLFGGRAQRVLDGLDLEVERGTTQGLVGTTGSGKSTLLRVLAGVLPARRGRVLVLGGTPADAGVRRRLGFVPEDSPFPPEVRALEALVLLGTLRGLGRREARAGGRALLGEVGLAAEERTPLGRFSRGMARRFALAQAELHRPELLLLDEPTAGLDAPGLGVFERLLDGARARGVTVVMSSHLATDVTRHADRLAVLADGRVARAGPPAELLGAEGLLGLYRSLEPDRDRDPAHAPRRDRAGGRGG